MRSIGVLILNLFFACSGAMAATQNSTILVFGDSLSAGYGMRADQGWATLLQQRLSTQGYGQRVVNASVSGETTIGGMNRLVRALDLQKPDVVILELGANDGLRGLPLATVADNLSAMIQTVKQRKARVLLLGLQLPPNYGPQYTRGFRDMFTDLAKRHDIALVPFMLDKVALDERYMQADGLHPNVQGQPLLLDTIWPYLMPLLQR
ncbi:MAG TPA: arylesterase [Steroidobacteraceae bacterium]|nr:arylesterase [Steroidobacteraceae bacterium]